MSVAAVLSALTAAAGPGALAVVGAVARNAWATPRATTDLDLAVAARPEVLRAAEDALTRWGYSCVRRHQVEPGDPLPDLLIFRGERQDPRQVDLLVAKTPFEREALTRAVRVDVGGVAAPVVTPEDLLVYKLISFRPQDRADLRSVARVRAKAGQPVDWAYVARWAAAWGVEDRLAVLRAELET